MGKHWVFTAVVAPLSPISWWLASEYSPRWKACTAGHPGAKDQAFSGPCGGTFTLAALGQITLFVLATTLIVGLFVGLSEGRNRRGFAQRRWVCAVVVGVCMPPTLAVYAIGYGLGRLMPAPKPSPQAVMFQQAWQAAVTLYRDLAGGHPPLPVVASGFLRPEPIFLDAQLQYARYYGMNVSFQPGSTVAVGSASFVAGAMIGGAIGNLAGQARAANMARTQWREHVPSRVVVTATSTWCNVQGRWLAFDHAAVMEYYLDSATCVLTFADVEPLRLSGPAAAFHAVLFAYLRDSEQWRQMPFLHNVAQAALAP